MIQSFKCGDTQTLFETGKTQRFANIKAVAERKLTQLAAASTLGILRSPAGNQLESLLGDRSGQHSMQINKPWRLCFVWTEKGPAEVGIVDHH